MDGRDRWRSRSPPPSSSQRYGDDYRRSYEASIPTSSSTQRYSQPRNVAVDFGDFQNPGSSRNRSPPPRGSSSTFGRALRHSASPGRNVPPMHESRSYGDSGSRRMSPPPRGYGEPSSSRRRSRSPQQYHSGSVRRSRSPDSIWNHNPNNVLDGLVKEYIDDFTGLLDVEIRGQTHTAFFHATSVWLTDRYGNPYGPPVKFTDVLGKNTATTRENTNVSLDKEMPIGSEVLLKAIPVQSDVVQFAVLFLWPKSTDTPPQPKTENEQKIAEKKQEYFLKEFHNKLSGISYVEGSFPGCIPSLYPDVQAVIWEIRDHDHGLIEIKSRTFRFFALFHREDVWLRDGKRGVDIDFFKHKPLNEMAAVGTNVNLIARSVLSEKGVAMSSSVLELQAIVVSLNPDRIPLGAPRPTWVSGGPGVIGGQTNNKSCRFLQHELGDKLNVKLRNYLHATGKKLPNLDPEFVAIPGQPTAMASQIQIKKERFEEYQQQQRQPQPVMLPQQQQPPAVPSFAQPPPGVAVPTFPPLQNPNLGDPWAAGANSGVPPIMSMPPPGVPPPGILIPGQPPILGAPPPVVVEEKFPKNLTNHSAKVLQHVGKHMLIAENFDKTWKVLCTTDFTILPPGVNCVANLFPLASPVKFNAKLVNPDKPIQYAATCIWSKKYMDFQQTIGRDKEVNDSLLMDYYSVLKTLGPILESGSTKKPDPNLLEFQDCTVFRVLDDNFAILKCDKGLILCDTCDVWLDPETTAQAASKTIRQVINIGDQRLVHAALIDSKNKIQYLASSVWDPRNKKINPRPIPKEELHAEKVNIYNTVLKSVQDSIEAHPPPSTNNDEDPKMIMSQRGIIRLLFYDKNWKCNSCLVGGFVSFSNGCSAFFLSKHFLQMATVPRVGLDVTANLYQLSTVEAFGEVTMIATTLAVGNRVQNLSEHPQVLTEKLRDAKKKMAEFAQLRPDCFKTFEHHKGTVVDVNSSSLDMLDPVSPPAVKVPAVGYENNTVYIKYAIMRCMVGEYSGILADSEDPKKLVYFELDDLNIQLPVNLTDIVMMCNRMKGVRVQVQAKPVAPEPGDKIPSVPLIANDGGVQIFGPLPDYMSHITLKKSPISHTATPANSPKMGRYFAGAKKYSLGLYKTIADLLVTGVEDLNQARGRIKMILNENYGVIEGPVNAVNKSYALFDLYDLYVADGENCEAIGDIGKVLKVGDEVTYNACFIDKNMAVTHLSTSLWKLHNSNIKAPQSCLKREVISDDKIGTYKLVVDSQVLRDHMRAIEEEEKAATTKRSSPQPLASTRRSQDRDRDRSRDRDRERETYRDHRERRDRERDRYSRDRERERDHRDHRDRDRDRSRYSPDSNERQDMLEAVFKGDYYRTYRRTVNKDERGPRDPKTPDKHDRCDQKTWRDRMNAWKSELHRWQVANAKDIVSVTKGKNSISTIFDDDITGTLDKLVHDRYAILALSNGKKAMVSHNRIWCRQGPMFGRWKALAMDQFKTLRVNARKIPETNGCEYQVTFAHVGMWRKNRDGQFDYPPGMTEWISPLLKTSKLDDEFNEFSRIVATEKMTPTLESYLLR